MSLNLIPFTTARYQKRYEGIKNVLGGGGEGEGKNRKFITQLLIFFIYFILPSRNDEWKHKSR